MSPATFDGKLTASPTGAAEYFLFGIWGLGFGFYSRQRVAMSMTKRYFTSLFSMRS